MESAEPELSWAMVFLRLLDIGLFLGEEAFKLAAAAAPVVNDAMATAADRAVKVGRWC